MTTMHSTLRGALCALPFAVYAGCASLPPAVEGPRATVAAPPRTRAERTGYRETSSHADVMAFLAALDSTGRVALDTLGRSHEGRAIPLVVASRPLVRTAAEARRLGRPIVWVQGNIHAGEVEGKEALQALLRDLVLAPGPGVLDSIVLVAVPIYNADGNERLAAQDTNRSEQNGPALVGRRANGQGLDLNRDYVKAEAPETRASLAAFAAWDPDVFVDLHTTNGSYHGYALTYSPSLHPGAALGAWTQDTLLPLLRERTRARHGVETYPYGNFALAYGADVTTDTTKPGWFSYDHRPRFGTNYVGLRNRVAILSEAYSHDPFARRVAATHAFVREILSLAAEQGGAIRERARAADARGGLPSGMDAVPLRSVLTRTPRIDTVIAEDLAADPDSVPDEPGVPRGLRRTGRFRPLRLPVHDRFDVETARMMPAAWIVDAARTDVVDRLRLHGVRVERLTSAWTGEVTFDLVDTVQVATRPFQGHREARVQLARDRRSRTAVRTVPAGTFVVRSAQPLAALAAVLLEPESDDGLATWNVLDAVLRAGEEYPVRRVATVPPSREPLPDAAR